MLSLFQMGSSLKFKRTTLHMEELIYRVQYGYPISEEDFDLLLTYINYYSIKNYNRVIIDDKKYFV